MATRVYTSPAVKPSKPTGADAPGYDTKEDEPHAEGPAVTADPPKATGLLWRMTSGAVGGVLGAAATAASGVRWAAGKGAEMGGAVIGTVSHKLPSVPLPFAAKKKDKDD